MRLLIADMAGSTDWNAISAIGQVAGAIATVAAVIVSLHLARRSERARLKIKCQLATTRPGSIEAGYIHISVANIGVRPERITALGWASRRRNATRFFFKPSEPASQDRLPALVQPGEAVQFAWTSEDFARCSDEMRDWVHRTRFLKFLYRRPQIFVGTASGEECRATVSHGVHLLFATGDSSMFEAYELRIVR